MGKMQHSYGAPLDRDEISLIGARLAVAYGSAKPSDASVTSLTASWEEAQTARDSKPSGNSSATDVQALLSANACLGCHATDGSSWRPADHGVGSICAEAVGDSNPGQI